MIEQLARALAKVLLQKDAGEYHEAISEIHKAGKLFLGLGPEAMEVLTDRELLRLWSVGGDLDAEKCALAAQIFRTEGEVYEHQGNLERASKSYEKSLGLLTHTITFLREKIPSELVASLEFLAGHLDVGSLPMELQQRLFASYSTLGKFAKAEDLLFEIVERDPSFIPEGMRFYEGLLKRNDDELVKGNLPRDEVAESLSELKQKL